MKHVFWLYEGKLAGRPGPDREPWDLSALRRGGIDSILSVNDGEHVETAEVLAQGLRYLCIPLSQNAPPLSGDEERCVAGLPVATRFVEGELDAGRTVMVHCSSGKDRTGLFLAHFAMRAEGLSAARAMAKIRSVRPIAFSAPGWLEHAERVLQRTSATQRHLP